MSNQVVRVDAPLQVGDSSQTVDLPGRSALRFQTDRSDVRKELDDKGSEQPADWRIPQFPVAAQTSPRQHPACRLKLHRRKSRRFDGRECERSQQQQQQHTG